MHARVYTHKVKPCFMVLPDSHKVRGEPSFAQFLCECLHSVKVTELLYCFHIISSLMFPLPTPLCYAALGHIPEIVWNFCNVFVCTQICVCVPLWSCIIREETLHMLFVCMLQFLHKGAYIVSMRNSSFNTLQVLILNYNFSTYFLTGGDIIKAFSTFISFDIESNRRLDLRMW